MQSMVVADADGNIGMIAPGRVPVRDPANKMAGRAPVPGWDATYDWKGYLKFEDLPRVDRSRRRRHRHGQRAHRRPRLPAPPHLRLGCAVTASSASRSSILDRDDHDIASMRAAQADVLSPAVRAAAAADDRGRAGRRLASTTRCSTNSTAWDATMRGRRAEPLIFTAWVREAVRAIYSDDLGAAFDALSSTRAPRP